VPFCLAAARGVAIAVALVLTAAAEQDQQDDDPADVAAKEAVVTTVTHKNTSKFLMRFAAAHSMVFRKAKYVLVSAFVFCFRLGGLGAKVKSDNGGENGQKFLSRQVAAQTQHVKYGAHGKGNHAFDGQ
jgi:hypothetical protein